MPKKELNQNDKIKHELIDTFEPNFTFGSKPINRFNILDSNDAKNFLDKAEKLSKDNKANDFSSKKVYFICINVINIALITNC